MTPTSGPYVVAPRSRRRIAVLAAVPVVALGGLLAGCLSEDASRSPETEVRTVDAPTDAPEQAEAPDTTAPTVPSAPTPEAEPDVAAEDPGAAPEPAATPDPAPPAPGEAPAETPAPTAGELPASAPQGEIAAPAPPAAPGVPASPASVASPSAPTGTVPAPAPIPSDAAPTPLPAPAPPAPEAPAPEAPAPAPPAPAPPAPAPPAPAPPAPAPPAPAVPAPSGGTPTRATTGPRVANPVHIGTVEVNGPMTLTDVVVDGHIFVRSGADLVLDHVEVTDGIVFIAEPGRPMTKMHADGVRGKEIYAATANPDGSIHDLYYQGPSSEVPAELVVTNSYFNSPPATPPAHTETLAGFGWIRGARFVNTTFLQQGPNNLTQTATVNWHGADTLFDGCYFGWDPVGQGAAYFAVYVSGPRNVVRNSRMEIGMAGGGYIFPDPDKGGELATYIGNVDAFTGAAIGISR